MTAEEGWVSLSEAHAWALERYAASGRTISRKTVSRWASSGKIEAKREGRFWRARLESLREAVHKELGNAADIVVEKVVASADAAESVGGREERLRRFIERRSALFRRDLEAGID